MVQDNAPTGPKTKKGRSPAYPAIPLEEALTRAEVFRKLEGRNEAHVNTALAHWGYSPKSGQGLVTLSALTKFGLMSDSGSGNNRKVRLTDLAIKILLDDRPDSAERLALIREAALAPSIHKELWDKYQGALPSDLNLKFYLRTEKGFRDKAAEELVKEFRKTLDFTKLAESVIISPGSEELTKPEGEIIMPNTLIEPKLDASKVQEKRGQKQAIPPTLQQLRIPLTDAPWATVQIPVPMTVENWQELEDFLSLMKGPITGTRRQSTTEEQSAQK
jgi:hypothetical protein